MDINDFSYFTDGIGEIRISSDVIAGIAFKVCMEPGGIAGGEPTSSIKGYVNKMMSKQERCKIEIGKLEDGSCTVTATVVILAGINIPETAVYAQGRIKQEIESMSGVKVSQVNIYVSGVIFN